MYNKTHLSKQNLTKRFKKLLEKKESFKYKFCILFINLMVSFQYNVRFYLKEFSWGVI
jgi:hypothetical protein